MDQINENYPKLKKKHMKKRQKLNQQQMLMYHHHHRQQQQKKVSTSKVVPVTKPTNGKTSIQQDPTTSDLYKSLFTTSDAAKKKEKNKAHWVTYNPLYF